VAHEKLDILWDMAREAPHTIAFRQKEFILQMIDEFQFLNAVVYRDKNLQVPAKTLAGGYLSSAESKVAPLLVSGSWVGWLMKELKSMLPARFIYEYLENMPQEEAVEMVYKYSSFYDVPISEESAYLLTRHCEGSPFYISSLIRSRFREKDLTTIKGLTRTMEFETLDNRGNIKATWMEYLLSAFKQVNDKNAKSIVLYLCRNIDREVTRQELAENLKLDINDAVLEKKMAALVKGDIVDQGSTNFRYRGVQDNIFSKVFRGVYQDEIDRFDVATIGKEYGREFENLKKKYHSLMGKYNYRQGYFAEYVILDRLKLQARKNSDLLKSITRNLPEDFIFCDYARVWKYSSSPEHSRDFSVDIFAHALDPENYSIIGEIKNRDKKKFSRDEAAAFLAKFENIKKLENLDRVVGFIFSRNGFTAEAEEFCRQNGIAYSDDRKWIVSGPAS